MLLFVSSIRLNTVLCTLYRREYVLCEDIEDNATVGCGRTLFLLDPSGVTPTIRIISFFSLSSFFCHRHLEYIRIPFLRVSLSQYFHTRSVTDNRRISQSFLSCRGSSRHRARRRSIAMALSKTNKIIILLVIDTAFFLLELIAGSLLPLLKESCIQ